VGVQFHASLTLAQDGGEPKLWTVMKN